MSRLIERDAAIESGTMRTTQVNVKREIAERRKAIERLTAELKAFEAIERIMTGEDVESASRSDPASPRKIRITANGTMASVVDRILRAADRPMTLEEIEKAYAEAVGKPVISPNRSLRNSIYRVRDQFGWISERINGASTLRCAPAAVVAETERAS